MMLLIFYLYITYSNIEQLPSPDDLQQTSTEQTEQAINDSIENAIIIPDETSNLITSLPKATTDTLHQYIIENDEQWSPAFFWTPKSLLGRAESVLGSFFLLRAFCSRSYGRK